MIWNVHRIADNSNKYFVQKNIKYVLTVSKEIEKKTNQCFISNKLSLNFKKAK